MIYHSAADIHFQAITVHPSLDGWYSCRPGAPESPNCLVLYRRYNICVHAALAVGRANVHVHAIYRRGAALIIKSRILNLNFFFGACMHMHKLPIKFINIVHIKRRGRKFMQPCVVFLHVHEVQTTVPDQRISCWEGIRGGTKTRTTKLFTTFLSIWINASDTIFEQINSRYVPCMHMCGRSRIQYIQPLPDAASTYTFQAQTYKPIATCMHIDTLIFDVPCTFMGNVHRYSR